MSDWVLTGITFFTTDLIYYEIGKIFCGVTPEAIYVTGGLMVSSALIAGVFASMSGEKKCFKLKLFLFISLVAIPCHDYIFSFRVHTGAVFLCLVSFLLVYGIFSKNSDEKKKKVYISLLFLCFLFVTIGDLLFVMEGIAPIIMICFFGLLDADEAEDKKQYIQIVGITILAIICAFLWEKIYFSVGGADKNSFMEDFLFFKPKKWVDRFLSFLTGSMTLSMGDFGGGKVTDFWNLLKGINFLVLLISFVFVIKNLYGLVKQKIKMLDMMSALLSCSVFMAFLSYLLTTKSEERYITIVPLACGIIFIRNIDSIINVKNKRFCIGFIVILSLLSLVGKTGEVSKYIQYVPNEEKCELVEFLEEHGLEKGYASFWNASDLTVLSENRIKVRHIIINENGMEMYKWFAKNEWYLEEAEFVVIDNKKRDGGESDSYGVSETNIKNSFGEAFERFEVGNYIVLVYDSDLSQKLLSE